MDTTDLDENFLLPYVPNQRREGDEQYLTQSQEIEVTNDAHFTASHDTEEKDHDSTLIALVAQFPLLYDKQCADYKNASMRENCWREIGVVLNTPAVDCSKRWGQLRDSYSRETRKRDDETRSGSGATKRKGFPLYNDMEFLRKHIQKRKTFTNVVVSTSALVNRTSFRPIATKNYAVRQPMSYASTPVPTRFLGTSLTSVRASTLPVDIPVPTLSVRGSIPPPSPLTPPSNPPALHMTAPAPILPFDTPTPSPPSTPTPPQTTTTPIPTTPKPSNRPAETQSVISRPSSTLSSYSSLSSCTDASSSCYAVDENDNSCYDVASDLKIPARSSRSSLLQNLASDRPLSQHRDTHVLSSMNTNYEQNVPARPLPQPKTCFNKDSGKRQKVDPIEASFLNLSSALQNHFQNNIPKQREMESMTSDQTFANLIVSELGAMAEPLKNTKKARLLQVLFE